MKKKNGKKGLRVINIAITSSFGNQAWQTPDVEMEQLKIQYWRQETDKGIAAAVKGDGRFAYRLASYQSVAGVMNSRKVFDIIILFVKGENTDDLKPEEMHWLKNTSARIICVAEGTGFQRMLFG